MMQKTTTSTWVFCIMSADPISEGNALSIPDRILAAWRRARALLWSCLIHGGMDSLLPWP
jgi:hypothetical protein